MHDGDGGINQASFDVGGSRVISKWSRKLRVQGIEHDGRKQDRSITPRRTDGKGSSGARAIAWT